MSCRDEFRTFRNDVRVYTKLIRSLPLRFGIATACIAIITSCSLSIVGMAMQFPIFERMEWLLNAIYFLYLGATFPALIASELTGLSLAGAAPGSFVLDVSVFGELFTLVFWFLVGSVIGWLVSLFRHQALTTELQFGWKMKALVCLAGVALILRWTAPLVSKGLHEQNTQVITDITTGSTDPEGAAKQCRSMGDANFQRSECFVALAKSSKNIGYCKEAPFRYTECYEQVGQAAADVTICSQIERADLQVSIEECKRNGGNDSFCRKNTSFNINATYEASVTACVRGAMKGIIEQDACSQVHGKVLSECLYQLALNTNDPDLCLNPGIDSDHSREQCLQRTATSDEYCDHIKTSYTKDFCKAAVAEKQKAKPQSAQ